MNGQETSAPHAAAPQNPVLNERLAVFVIMTVVFITLSIFRAQTIGGDARQVINSSYLIFPFVLGFILLFLIGWVSLLVCAAILTTLKLLNRLKPTRANIAFLYSLASIIAIVITLLHFFLEMEFPIRETSYRVSWEYTGAIAFRVIHTLVAVSTIGVGVANSKRVHRQIAASPSEPANNVALWVGLIVAVVVIVAGATIVPWAILTFKRLEREGWFLINSGAPIEEGIQRESAVAELILCHSCGHGRIDLWANGQKSRAEARSPSVA